MKTIKQPYLVLIGTKYEGHSVQRFDTLKEAREYAKHYPRDEYIYSVLVVKELTY